MMVPSRGKGARSLAGLALLFAVQFAPGAEAAERWITHPTTVQADAERAPRPWRRSPRAPAS